MSKAKEISSAYHHNGQKGGADGMAWGTGRVQLKMDMGTLDDPTIDLLPEDALKFAEQIIADANRAMISPKKTKGVD